MDYDNRNAQYWVTIAVSLTSLTASMSFSWTTPVLPKFHNNETDIYVSDLYGCVNSLYQEDISWLVSAPVPGMMTGCIIAQFPAQNLGRRPTVLISAFPFIIGTIFVLNATKAWMLGVARFCWGFSCGMIQTVVMIYIVEIASKDIRGRLTVGNRFLFNLGALLILSVGSYTSYQTLSYFLIVVPVCYLIACCFIPETPYFLLKEGKVEAARKVLMQLNGYKDEKTLDEKLNEMKSNVNDEMQRSSSLKELLTGKKYRRAIIISVGLATTRFLCGSIALKQYIGRILQETTSDVSVTGGLIVFGAVTFITSIFASMLVDKLGRRPLLLFSFIATAITLVILGVCFFMNEVMNIKPGYFGYINLFGNLFLCIVSTMGYDTVGFIIPAEIFPLNVKSTAMTYVSLVGYIVNFAAIRGYQIVKDISGLYGVFWFFGFASFVGAVFTYAVVPETKGKSLREIQQELQGDLFNDTIISPVASNEGQAGVSQSKDTEDTIVEELKPLKA